MDIRKGIHPTEVNLEWTMVILLVVVVFVVVVVVVVIAQQLFSYRQLSRLRKSVTAAGLSHRSCTVSCVGWL